MLKNTVILVVLIRLFYNAESCHECEVGIALSAGLEVRSYIPHCSFVHVNCTAGSSQTPEWSIYLPQQENPTQFTFAGNIRRLNDHGIYKLEDTHFGHITIIQLFINTTERISGTVVRCFDPDTGMTIAQTTLVIVNPSPISLLATGAYFQSVMLSWSPSLSSVDINETYTLTVMSSNTQPQILEQDETGYVFNAPKGAPPCEVYNFSVTASLIGTTATRVGTGCSVSSETVTTMLPSLPDISRMESSIDYVLKKTPTMGFELGVSFMPATHCEMYPVTSYVLEVEGPSTINKSESDMASALRSITIENLLENIIYKFSIIVSNNVGSLSTSKTKFYTTDVQMVRALQLEGDNAVMLQCTFVNGSDAIGCLVLLQLVDEADNTTVTVKMTREGMHTCVKKVVNLTKSSTYISKILGYDIKSNGSISTLPVPGELSRSLLNCGSSDKLEDNTPNNAILVIIVATTVIVVILTVLALTLSPLCYNFKRSQSVARRVSRLSIKPLLELPSSPDPVVSDSQVKSKSINSEQNTALYDSPIQNQNETSRIPGDGTDQNYYSTAQDQQESQGPDVKDNIAYAEVGDVKENVYHVLECNLTPRGIDSEVIILPGPDAPELPSSFKEKSPVPPPIYQDISDLTGGGTKVT